MEDGVKPSKGGQVRHKTGGQALVTGEGIFVRSLRGIQWDSTYS